MVWWSDQEKLQESVKDEQLRGGLRKFVFPDCRNPLQRLIWLASTFSNPDRAALATADRPFRSQYKAFSISSPSLLCCTEYPLLFTLEIHAARASAGNVHGIVVQCCVCRTLMAMLLREVYLLTEGLLNPTKDMKGRGVPSTGHRVGLKLASLGLLPGAVGVYS
jgi:hypothetical protein